MTQAFSVEGTERRGRWVVTCDHASNRVPPEVAGGDLGLPPEDMNRHIAYDVGAAGVSRRLAEVLDAPVILSNFSRLVIDPNRGEDDPTLCMKIYDGSIIPANRHADAAEIERRLALFHRPYHRALSDLIARRADPVIVSIHSFTPQFVGRPPRPWHVGVLYAGDTRLAYPLIARLRDEPDLCVGDNEPYSGHLPGDALDRHAVQPGRLHVLVEIRNDLIATPAQQAAWGERLAPLLDAALKNAEV
ncbi:N-formylglutamate amidohydrolase [Roseicyclus marinus]|uniref:N-formylglutamate amidohydrolase n=1 Tax=Roseicyclus marinus TaxID=2161673 RepID=UPI00240EF099|nr:N-formylglutamate amidohydrolase [Roseicyclus marinus]MDG3041020.1 N-formylglutamate amidohydrolase [Roseicyclus marinus]